MKQKIKGPEPTPDSGPLVGQYLEKVNLLLKTIKYGSLTIIVQDGKVIQIDKNEKMRLV